MIFKAYDIRGRYPEQLDEQMAYKIARAYADLRLQDNAEKVNWTIAVGRDMRLSSPQLHREVMRGLVEAGFNVVDIGLVSTPAFYFAVGEYGYDGGIMVSASHNPKDDNGLKMVRERALPISANSGIKWIEERVASGEFKASGEGSISRKEGVVKAHVEAELEAAHVEGIKEFHIVTDTANAVGIQFLEEMFKHFPCKVTYLNKELDGTFPAHQADPLKEENMKQLQEKVVALGADLGISTDGDGDRIFFVDDKGKTISPALIRGLVAMIVLREHPGATICYDIRPGKITRDLIVEHGGKPEITRVGHSLIKEHSLEVGAAFAGESSGHFFVNFKQGFYEGPVYVTAKLLEEFSKSGTVSDYVKPYDHYAHSGEINSKVSDKEAVLSALKQKYADGELNEIDGVTVTYSNWWFNVRPSNTESVLRLNLEAVDAETMKEKRDEVLGVIRSN